MLATDNLIRAVLQGFLDAIDISIDIIGVCHVNYR